jgi:hypothetical protein
MSPTPSKNQNTFRNSQFEVVVEKVENVSEIRLKQKDSSHPMINNNCVDSRDVNIEIISSESAANEESYRHSNVS